MVILSITSHCGQKRVIRKHENIFLCSINQACVEFTVNKYLLTGDTVNIKLPTGQELDVNSILDMLQGQEGGVVTIPQVSLLIVCHDFSGIDIIILTGFNTADGPPTPFLILASSRN